MQGGRTAQRLSAIAATAAAALFVGLLGAPPAFAATDGSGVVINEVYARGGSASQPYTNKFVELYNPTNAAVSLAGWSLQYRSATGTAGGLLALDGSIASGGHYLISLASNGSNGEALPTPDASGTMSPQGSNGIVFLSNATSAINPGIGSIVNAPNVIDYVGYGSANGFEGSAAVYGDGVTPPGNTVPGSISRTLGADTDNNAADFAFSSTPTPQNSGAGPVDPEPEPEVATIAEVQGSGDASPLVGKTVTVEGVVTGDYRTGGYNGVTIQTPGPDTTPGVSDGLFVFGMPTVGKVGDLVQVTGAVSEYFGLTQITADAASAKVLTADAGVPDAQPLPDATVGGAREALESMLVAPTGNYLLSSTHEVYNYGSLWLSAGDTLPVKSTELVDAGADANAIAAANRGRLLVLDDGWNSAVTSAAHPNEQPYLTKDQVVRNGDRVILPSTPYVLSYGFDAWRLQPTTPIDSASPASVKPTFETLNPRVATAPAVGGDLQVGVFNVLNYFTTLLSENSNARGAATAEEFALQEKKIVKAIIALNAEVVALQEIENSLKLGEARDEATATLVAALNEAQGSDVWAFVPTPAVLTAANTDFIQSAIIYRTDAVTPKGAAQTVDDETVWGNAREPIGQVFTLPNGNDFSVVANHFKSKSGSGTQPADGQGFFNADRIAQATSLLGLANTLAAEAGEVFLLGDFNSYSEEDPIQVLTEAGYSDLLPDRTDDQYTYTFDGELGSLDHALGNAAAVQGVTGIGRWAINSPEWSDRQYENGSPDDSVFRSSDHDPQVIGLDSAKLTDVVDISVMTINDFHGRIEQAAPSAGAAVLAGAADAVRAENPNTVFAAAGDLIGASTFTSFIQKDSPTIAALNAAGLDVSAAGNHEFDQGWKDLRDRVQGEADFEYISSNVFLKGTNETALAPYYTQTFEGVTVGFIGAVTEELPSLVSPAGIADLDVRPIVASVNAQAENLTDGVADNGEADVLILLVHEGATTSALSSVTDGSVFGKIVAGVDPKVNAIVSAHTHLPYNHVVDGRPVVSAGQYGEQFGLMKLEVDPESKELLSISNELKPLMTTATTNPPVPAKALYPADPEVAAIVADAKAKADVLGAVKVGNITADFNRGQMPGTDANGNPVLVEARGAESTIGNFVADVQLWAAKQDGTADIAFMNPGGMRTDLKFKSTGAADPDGNVTYREAANVQPFANTLFTQTLTGAQVKQVLEEQWQPAGASRPFLKLGVNAGLEVVYDPTAAAGSRVTHVSLDGVELDPAANYKVVANSFLAAGGDNFFTLGKGTGRADTGKVDLQAMVDWFTANKTATPDLAQRSVGLVLPAPANGTAYVPGETLNLALSSLDFSTTEVAAGEVTVSIGGIAVGTAPVDRTSVPATDEGGRASLTITIPEGIDGATALEIAVASTKTSVSVPITVDAPEPEAPVATITLGAPTSLLVRAGSSVTYKAQVFATDGSKPVGTVRVFDGSKLVGTVELTAAANGRVSVTVPKLSRGLHLLRAEFDGTAPYTDSRMFQVPVLAW
ncbi:ExeM/NucH family extracellular endonuclease [Agromyces aureus]|uniref:Multifunctional nuclease/2',3'-cyclic-nucleotide 2'-phosphodiesterase/5'-nucleotidase/3'-nucleotidase n=1 Tax=Agromyces aureus TaxID=453304 RepID=A0A191WIG2_9MICO|nr:ExeM/NucH family extracellular endonuclease [Agromyces aureus]ANJ28007.1 multifunctional nuclease/2',3'-cyclic-nucleotide 2'-phosphodiesterase/5'-nucleotidase/3'-nucleotidase [Agromyces aureus]